MPAERAKAVPSQQVKQGSKIVPWGYNMPEPFNSFDYLFPVLGGEASSQHDGGMNISEVYGTAFCLAENYFLTNEHVLRAVLSHPRYALGFLDAEYWGHRPIEVYELFAGTDIAIFRSNLPVAKYLNWQTKEQAMLELVQTTGYPYALDLASKSISPRSFRGNIVSARTWHGLPSKPRVYELPFLCPRGISGAPLWSPGAFPTPPSVVGVIFGNSITEMTVTREVEKTREGGETTIYERVEALHLGLAIQASSILSLESSLLKMSIGEFLKTKGLLNG